MSRLVVVVPRSRAYCGRAVLLGAGGEALAGPVRVLATASRRVARRHGNLSCDPLLPFGHPPAGTYAVATSLPPGFVHPRRPRRFGDVGALLLAPRGGDALTALKNGRSVFALHGGPVDTANRLRPTRGGLRVADADMLSLMRAVNAAWAKGDALAAIEVIEIPDADIRTVPPLDLRGARRALGLSRKKRSGLVPPANATSKGMLLLLLGAGAARGAGDREVDRREMLQAALLLVGGLVATACNQASPCTPLACDPTEPARHRGHVFAEGGAGDGGDGGGGDGAAADGGEAGASDAGADGSADASDGAAQPDAGEPFDAGQPPFEAGEPFDAGGPSPGGGGAPPPAGNPCPPSGYVCQDEGTDYVAGGGVG